MAPCLSTSTIRRSSCRRRCASTATTATTSCWSAAMPDAATTAPTMSDIDPVTREIVRNALAAAADEMAMALYRTAYSTIVRDCLDYSTSLCNAAGEMIAQGVTIPLHLGSVPFALATLFKKYGNHMEPGDVFILNDPFDGGITV